MPAKKKDRIAIVDGVRTPMGKAGTLLAGIEADELGTIPVREIVLRSGIDANEIDEVLIGNVAQPVHAANVARVIALKAGIPKHVPAATVHRNCASGMEAITAGMNRIELGRSSIVVAGGVESMSNIPLLYNKAFTAMFARLFRAKTLGQRLKVFASFRPHFLKPVVGLTVGLTDPTCGLIMGLTAENLSRDFKITREEQDAFSLRSHQRAVAAQEAGYLAEEIVPIPIPPTFRKVMEQDNGPRATQSMADLAKLRPYFDRKTGTVTVGSSSQVTDGAAAVLLMKESEAKARGLKPLGYVTDYAYAGCDPDRMGLGPAYATARLLSQTKQKFSEFDLIEINEAFAAQVIANLRAFDSDSFAKEKLGLSKKLGIIDPEKLNVNGGSIALGHPLGMTGTRIVITLLKELRRRKKKKGLATLCIGGGQGAALAVEAV